MNRVTSDDDTAGPPRPLVLGHYVYHWTTWSGVLLDVVYTPRFAQFSVRTDDGRDFVIKNTEHAYPDDADVQSGHNVQVFGLGDLSGGNMYHFCGLLDVTSRAMRHLNGWLQQIDWSTANQYFGWRTHREATDGVRAYYTAVYEVLARSCYGPLGTGFAEHVVPAAENEVRKWKFSF